MPSAILQFGTLAFQLFSLALSLFVLFFLSVGLNKPLSDFVEIMNKGQHTVSEWQMFASGALAFSFIYAVLWTWFKYAEKRSVEAYMSLTSTPEASGNKSQVIPERVVYRTRKCSGCCCNSRC